MSASPNRSYVQSASDALKVENRRLRAEVERLSKRSTQLESLLFEYVPLEHYNDALAAVEEVGA